MSPARSKAPKHSVACFSHRSEAACSAILTRQQTPLLSSREGHSVHRSSSSPGCHSLRQASSSFHPNLMGEAPPQPCEENQSRPVPTNLHRSLLPGSSLRAVEPHALCPWHSTRLTADSVHCLEPQHGVTAVAFHLYWQRILATRASEMRELHAGLPGECMLQG